MTRINLVPPAELTDQHLFAEFREIKMVPKALARSLRAKPVSAVLQGIPPEFTLNTGHVKFFYDKGLYLATRYEALRAELRRRGVQFNQASQLDPDGIMADPFCNDYQPTPKALSIIRLRIAEKINMKPSWYRYCGQGLQAATNQA